MYILIKIPQMMYTTTIQVKLNEKSKKEHNRKLCAVTGQVFIEWTKIHTMIYEVLPGEIPTCDMALKVATERKMKLRQETTSLSQIVTVTAKPTRSNKHL